MRADLTDEVAARDVVARARPDAVLHLASEVSGGREPGLIRPMLDANLSAAVNVMLASAECGSPRVVLAGSMEEPDPGDPEAVPQSPYAAAKWAATGYGRLFNVLYELPVVHLRVFMVYGPAQLDLRKLVPYVTVSLLRGRTPQLSSGDRLIDWVYVDDVAEAFLRGAVAPGADGRTFEIGSGELTDIRSLVLGIRDAIGSEVEPAFGALADRRLERVRVADPAGAASGLGWRPETSLDDGLARTIDFYRASLDALPEV